MVEFSSTYALVGRARFTRVTFPRPRRRRNPGITRKRSSATAETEHHVLIVYPLRSTHGFHIGLYDRILRHSLVLRSSQEPYRVCALDRSGYSLAPGEPPRSAFVLHLASSSSGIVRNSHARSSHAAVHMRRLHPCCHPLVDCRPDSMPMVAHHALLIAPAARSFRYSAACVHAIM